VWFVCYVNPNGFVAIVPSAGFGSATQCVFSFLAAGFFWLPVDPVELVLFWFCTFMACVKQVSRNPKSCSVSINVLNTNSVSVIIVAIGLFILTHLTL